MGVIIGKMGPLLGNMSDEHPLHMYHVSNTLLGI